jgi:hypothetical protein
MHAAYVHDLLVYAHIHVSVHLRTETLRNENPSILHITFALLGN